MENKKLRTKNNTNKIEKKEKENGEVKEYE
jgi:hypothetical protein